MKNIIKNLYENLYENFGDLSGVALFAITEELIFLFTLFAISLRDLIH